MPGRLHRAGGHTGLQGHQAAPRSARARGTSAKPAPSSRASPRPAPRMAAALPGSRSPRLRWALSTPCSRCRRSARPAAAS
ncbi:MAG: hypothetical protein ACK56F_14655, partial [bacterium]